MAAGVLAVVAAMMWITAYGLMHQITEDISVMTNARGLLRTRTEQAIATAELGIEQMKALDATEEFSIALVEIIRNHADDDGAQLALEAFARYSEHRPDIVASYAEYVRRIP